MIVTTHEMQAIEKRAFAHGVEAEALMEEAGAQIAMVVRQFFPVPGHALVFCGKGHNGGDALVAARYLAESGWRIRLDEPYGEEALAPLTRKKRRELIFGLNQAGANQPGEPTVILDGLLGIGGRPGLRDPLPAATARINRLRLEHGATVFSIDLPTGLDGDTGAVGPDTVVADVTLTIGFAKRGLLADGAIDHVGRLALLPLPALEREGGSPYPGGETLITPGALGRLCPPRHFGMHKGECGRVGIIAGAQGMAGAAVLCANAAIRAGAGLVTLFVPPPLYPQVAAAAMPEVMTRPLEDLDEVSRHRLDILAVGPGLGQPAYGAQLLDLMETFPGPMVIDADALNLLAAAGSLSRLRDRVAPRLLTPHPGEMARLFPEAASLSRKETVERFLGQETAPDVPLVLLLKGARTVIGQRKGADTVLAYNTTGTPGMAGGGMGDVLTGTCAALAGQGMPLFDAARLGAWLAGRTSEILISQGWRSQESLSAGDLGEFFGAAFRELRTGRLAGDSTLF